MAGAAGVTDSVHRTATKHEINKAYRKLAQQWHPDAYDGEDKTKAEKMFYDIAAAKEVLTDPGELPLPHTSSISLFPFSQSFVRNLTMERILLTMRLRTRTPGVNMEEASTLDKALLSNSNGNDQQPIFS